MFLVDQTCYEFFSHVDPTVIKPHSTQAESTRKATPISQIMLAASYMSGSTSISFTIQKQTQTHANEGSFGHAILLDDTNQ